MNIGFAFIPEKTFLKKLVEYQNKITGEYNLKPVLSLENNLPHITIIQGSFVEDFDYKYYLELLFNLFRESKNDSNLKFDRVQYEDIGWYFLMIQNPEFIKNIHNEFFENVKFHMCNKLNTPENTINYLNETQKQYYLNYSYRYLLDQYIPHVTLFRDESLNREGFLNKLNTEMKFIFDEITKVERLTVYKMGENGSHSETLLEKYL
jgi:2'-5' RNA ligase